MRRDQLPRLGLRLRLHRQSAEEMEEVIEVPARAYGTSDWPYLWERRCELKVRVLTNRYYQQERQRIFETRDGFIKVVSLVSGSVAFTGVLDPAMLKVLAFFLVLGSAPALVFNWGGKARDSAKRAAEWAEVERGIEEAGERRFTEEDLDKWTARCNEVGATEALMHRLIQERSFRRACRVLGRNCDEAGVPVGYRWRVPFFVP